MKNSSHSPVFEKCFNQVVVKYPCSINFECSAYEFTLPRGRYLIEAYGGSGGSPSGKNSTTARNNNECFSQSIVDTFGGNTICDPSNSAGSGGFISGIISLHYPTKFFAHIGGRGTYHTNQIPNGGYNGGGNGNLHSAGCSSGGGSTDLRAEIDDVFHRIIVAGGGGGSDDEAGTLGSTNDGAGGSGGYPEGQGFWINGVYNSFPHASQLYGFSFGQGESYGLPRSNHPNSTTTAHSYEVGGAGGGWFGGFISGHGNGGAGGGSSFILTRNCQIPKNQLNLTDGRYITIESGFYAFTNESPYTFESVYHATGIWSGHGQMKITLLPECIPFSSSTNSCGHYVHIFYLLLIGFYSK